MSLYFVVILVVAGPVISSGCDVHASLPKNKPSIDMSKFDGTWYETVSTIDTISLNHACLTFKDVNVNATGFKALLTFYYDNAPEIAFHIHLMNTEDGHFRQKYIEKEQAKAKEGDQNGNTDSQAISEYTEIEWQVNSYIGDPDHYFAYIRCSSKGWIVWALTRSKTITPEQFVYIHNDLLKRGITAPLRLARCGNISVKQI